MSDSFGLQGNGLFMGVSIQAPTGKKTNPLSPVFGMEDFS
jgi:hypothetical protein